MVGVQFHPESIGSEHGEQLIGNFLAIAAQHTQEPRGRRAHTQGQENVRVAQTQSVAVYELAAPEGWIRSISLWPSEGKAR